MVASATGRAVRQDACRPAAWPLLLPGLPLTGLGCLAPIPAWLEGSGTETVLHAVAAMPGLVAGAAVVGGALVRPVGLRVGPFGGHLPRRWRVPFPWSAIAAVARGPKPMPAGMLRLHIAPGGHPPAGAGWRRFARAEACRAAPAGIALPLGVHDAPPPAVLAPVARFGAIARA
jgi:hypothetical protein